MTAWADEGGPGYMDTPNSSELAPCPFCGSPARPQATWAHPTGRYTCSNKKCPVIYGTFSPEEWNSRSASQGQAVAWITPHASEILHKFHGCGFNSVDITCSPERTELYTHPVYASPPNAGTDAAREPAEGWDAHDAAILAGPSLLDTDDAKRILAGPATAGTVDSRIVGELRECRSIFMQYAQLHRNKNTEEGDKKYQANITHVRRIDLLLNEVAATPAGDQARDTERLLDVLQALVTAVCYADPPKEFNGVLCHEARVPVEFISNARAAIAAKRGGTEMSAHSNFEVAGDVAEQAINDYLRGIDREREPLLRKAWQLRRVAVALEQHMMKGRDHRILIRIPDGSGIIGRFVDIDVGKQLRDYAASIECKKAKP